MSAQPLVDALHRVISGHDLSAAEAQAAVEAIMAGGVTDVQVAGFLTALRMKGETVDEIAGAVSAMRAHVLPIPISRAVVLDTCGTGGDGAGTFNISTAVAFVCAARGVTVAKHGNRAISSRVGSADVLEALGVRVDLDADAVRACVEALGIGFMYAPTHHAALRHAATARRQLGFRTIFNLLGPMTNPANATHQLVGIFDPGRLRAVAEVLGRLGARRAMVVHGDDGLDEVSVSGPTRAAIWDAGAIREITLTPAELGVPRSPIAAVAGGGPQENAAIIRAVLAGERRDACADIVRLNAGCALWVAERADDFAHGVALATETLASGDALAKLEALARMTQASSESPSAPAAGPQTQAATLS